ncbi:Aspartyl/Asparaginyl beta-hydroxylase [seawater metagenome]|uniref:Aspartyl/Asparaginyl beta-hydroxylase n=1 Tax=seawater metagenome TaxID=1561972 RepID=A0A5E8CJY0_9ZZZZ
MINIKLILLGVIILLVLSRIVDLSMKVRVKPEEIEPKLISTDNYPITKILEKNWEKIANECKNLPSRMIGLEGRSQFAWYGDKETENLANSYFKDYGWINGWKVDEKGVNKKWKNWALVYDGKLLGHNSKICPETSKLLAQIPGIRVAGFSILKTNGDIPPHTDTTGFKYNSLAFHLGLDVPKDAPSKLYILDSHIKEKNGKAFLFDASFTHSADNKSNTRDRAILYIDFDLKGIKPIKAPKDT